MCIYTYIYIYIFFFFLLSGGLKSPELEHCRTELYIYMGARCTFLAPPPPMVWSPPPYPAPYPAVLAVTLEALLVLVLRGTINT